MSLLILYRNKGYDGISDTKFKSPYTKHRKSFKKRKNKTDTELSNEICKLMEQSKKLDIPWKTLVIHPSYNTKQYTLSLNEKLAIAPHKQDNILNKRTEIISKYRHSNKYKLANYESKDQY